MANLRVTGTWWPVVQILERGGICHNNATYEAPHQPNPGILGSGVTFDDHFAKPPPEPRNIEPRRVRASDDDGIASVLHLV